MKNSLVNAINLYKDTKNEKKKEQQLEIAKKLDQSISDQNASSSQPSNMDSQ